MLAAHGTLTLLNRRFPAGARFAHELQDSLVQRFLIHVSELVAEERQCFLLGEGGGERGVDETV